MNLFFHEICRLRCSIYSVYNYKRYRLLTLSISEHVYMADFCYKITLIHTLQLFSFVSHKYVVNRCCRVTNVLSRSRCMWCVPRKILSSRQFLMKFNFIKKNYCDVEKTEMTFTGMLYGTNFWLLFKSNQNYLPIKFFVFV